MHSKPFWPSDTFSLICDWVSIAGFVVTLVIAWIAGGIAKRIKERVRLTHLSADVSDIFEQLYAYREDAVYTFAVRDISMKAHELKAKLNSVARTVGTRSDMPVIRQTIDLIDTFGRTPTYNIYMEICGKARQIDIELADRVKDQQWESVR
jgi:hypothetical protein